ncbi:MAG: hypothetical protein FD137_707 [Spirochaetes bacterium]|nr:MAG: hypothetical protein FD137_707 [Spirochaetota bacterium]
MDRHEYNALVSAFEHAYDALLDKVMTLSPMAIHFVPSMPDAWSINEHLVHLLDADCNLVSRARSAIAEPGKRIMVWDQEAWREGNNYSRSDGIYCLDLAISIRKFLAESLRTISDEVREAARVDHPDRGVLTLADLLSIYTGHADFHMNYVERNLHEFAKR